MTEQVSHITTFQAGALKASGFGEKANTELTSLISSYLGSANPGVSFWPSAAFSFSAEASGLGTQVLPTHKPLCSKTGISLPCF